MRQPQRTNNNNSSNRARGRGRKSPNSMSKSLESNGPDVKIRGNASHIAEKYATLAQDAQTAGDRVVAENYYQHAEHYNRVVAAAAAAAASAQEEKRLADSNIQNNAQSRKPETGADTASVSGNRPQPEMASKGDVVLDVESAGTPEIAAQDEKQTAQPRAGENRSLRTRRPRKPEPRQVDKGTDDAGEVKASKGDQGGENISEDALGLPDSILGSA